MYLGESPPSEYTYIGKVTVPGGDAGARETLKLMKGLALEGKRSAAVRRQAIAVCDSLQQKAYWSEAKKLCEFVRDKIRYIRDIDGIETLQTAEKTLEVKAGDCDDKSVLLAALLLSVGHPCRFRAVGNTPGAYSHVYVESKIGDKWVPLETTEPWTPGTGAPHKHFMVMHI